jgi:nitroimidazol reductase NimA-like FMN-containing flavoprotein (pyridoxamine 5'-phosphate oxidase superfamily)
VLEDHGLEILSDEECVELLKIARIGRVGISVGAVPAIFPVNFALLDGDIVFRSGEGTKLDAALRGATVAFQVDRIDAVYEEGWSVFVVGTAAVVRELDELEKARQLGLRSWADGQRHRFVRIRPEFISGRRILHPPIRSARDR